MSNNIVYFTAFHTLGVMLGVICLKSPDFAGQLNLREQMNSFEISQPVAVSPRGAVLTCRPHGGRGDPGGCARGGLKL